MPDRAFSPLASSSASSVRSLKQTFVSTLLVAGLAVGLMVGLTACDSGEEPPQPEFQAEVSGAVTQSLDGTAGVTDSEALSEEFRGTALLIDAAVPDSLVPDSLMPGGVVPPDSGSVPPATVLLLTAPTDADSPFGQTLAITIPGEDVPAPGAYQVGVSEDPDSGPPTSATYIDNQPDTLLASIATAGTVQIESSSADVIRGRFTLETDQAVAVVGLGGGIPQPGSIEFRPFETTVEGSFTALRSADNQPLLPDVGVSF